MEPNIQARRAAFRSAENELIRTSLVRTEQQHGVATHDRARAADAKRVLEPGARAAMQALRAAVARSNDTALKRAYNLACGGVHDIEDLSVAIEDDDLEGSQQSREGYARSRDRARVGRARAQDVRESSLGDYYNACHRSGRTARAVDAAPVGDLLARRRAWAAAERGVVTAQATDAQPYFAPCTTRRADESDLEFYERAARLA